MVVRIINIPQGKSFELVPATVNGQCAGCEAFEECGARFKNAYRRISLVLAECMTRAGNSKVWKQRPIKNV